MVSPRQSTYHLGMVKETNALVVTLGMAGIGWFSYIVSAFHNCWISRKMIHKMSYGILKCRSFKKSSRADLCEFECSAQLHCMENRRGVAGHWVGWFTDWIWILPGKLTGLATSHGISIIIIRGWIDMVIVPSVQIGSGSPGKKPNRTSHLRWCSVRWIRWLDFRLVKYCFSRQKMKTYLFVYGLLVF